MEAKYELKNGNILKDGHTMFLEDIAQDLRRKSYLENTLKTSEKAALNIADVSKQSELLIAFASYVNSHELKGEEQITDESIKLFLKSNL